MIGHIEYTVTKNPQSNHYIFTEEMRYGNDYGYTMSKILFTRLLLI